MVSHIQTSIDDEVADRVREVKDEKGLTWAEFLEEAAKQMDEENE